jgi:hypothetical protein
MLAEVMDQDMTQKKKLTESLYQSVLDARSMSFGTPCGTRILLRSAPLHISKTGEKIDENRCIYNLI